MRRISLYRFLVLLLISSILSACTEPTSPATHTDSAKFSSLAEKQECLERYVTFRRNYQSLEFQISFYDQNPRTIPGPNDWNIRVFATVPPDELDDWISGLPETTEPEAKWITQIPNAPTDISHFTWHEKGGKTVGIDRQSNSVLYWNWAM